MPTAAIALAALLWAVAATVWYVTASEYNRHYKAGGTNVYDMRAALTAIKRGDEDFFASNTYRAGISHAAIYIGDGMIIHAPRSGRDVEEVSMYYWITPNFYARP